MSTSNVVICKLGGMRPTLGDLRSLSVDRAAAAVDGFVLRVTRDGSWDMGEQVLVDIGEQATVLPAGHPALVGVAALRASLASAVGDSPLAVRLWAEVGRLANTHPGAGDARVLWHPGAAHADRRWFG